MADYLEVAEVAGKWRVVDPGTETVALKDGSPYDNGGYADIVVEDIQVQCGIQRAMRLAYVHSKREGRTLPSE